MVTRGGNSVPTPLPNDDQHQEIASSLLYKLIAKVHNIPCYRLSYPNTHNNAPVLISIVHSFTRPYYAAAISISYNLTLDEVLWHCYIPTVRFLIS